MTMTTPMPPNEQQRLESLSRYEVLDTPPEEALDELARLAAQITGTPIALITLVDAERLFFKSRVGVTVTQAPRQGSLCTEAILSHRVMMVTDVQADPRWAGQPLALDGRAIRFYAGAPLVNSENHALGVLCVMDEKPRELPWEQLEALRILAHQVMLHLELRLNVRALEQAAEDYHRAMQALEESEAFYHSLVESLPQHIIRKDDAGRFTFANQRFCQMLGLKPEEILGRTDFDFFPPEMAEKFRRDDQMVMQSRQPLDIIEANQTKDGQKRYVHVIKTPIFDAFNHVIGVQGIFWDVTERKQMEEALAYERDLLRALLANTPDLIYFKDVDLRILRCSASMARWLGLASPDQAIGRTDFDFLPREIAQRRYEEEQQLLLTGKPVLEKLEEIVDAEGVAHSVITNKVPLYSSSGHLRGLIGISTEVTRLLETEKALRTAQEKYRTIFERAVEGIFQTTPDGRYLDANPALARMYGYDSREELMRALTDIEHQLYVNPHRREEFIRLMREKGTVTGFESEVYRRDGSTIWISENARAVQDENGEVAYYEGTVEEITARKKAEMESENARRAAVESARLKTEFLTNVSHEIRTPMNGIVGIAGLLAETHLTEEQREYVEIIRSSASALQDLINELLDLSKIEAGRMALEKIPFPLRDLAETTLEVLAERAHQKNLELVSWVNCDLPVMVQGDAGRLRQVLLNLAGNAVKFTEQGEVLVHISKLAENDHQVTVRFEVRDTGIGIPPEAQGRIFQSFVQADGSTTRRYGGTGLGLAISKQLVELMGGRIGVHSTPGHGSTFWFEVPLDKVPDQPATPGRLQNVQALAGLSVLLVDDHQATRELVEYLLGYWGMRVELAATSAQAMEKLRARKAAGQRFDFILLDMQMPDVSGLALARQIKADGLDEHARLLLFTLVGQRPDPEVLHAAGIALCLFKPLKQTRLLECLIGLATGREDLLHPLLPDAVLRPVDPSRTLRVLVAEDNPVNQKVALRQLAKLGLRADAVANGKEAIEALERIPYDVVLLDCNMPEMDGYTAAREIKRRLHDPQAQPPLRSRPYLIAITANALLGDRERCLAAGMDDYVQKPVELSELLAAFTRAGIPIRPAAPAPAATPAPATPETSPPANPGGDATLPVLDNQALLRLRQLQQAGQPDPVVEMIDLFLQDLPRRLQLIGDAVHRQDAAALKNAAHSLKGSARNMGAARLAALCAELEKLGHEGQTGPVAASLWEQLQQHVLELTRTLEQTKHSTPPPMA
ncbi:PAS domain S-box protein [Fontisphaera persica]|uniref:PAS domain S-box protein n=1 Tax=Fontisphaera persica TaxID=2974023 RepID=UPI0024C0C820|nr:PAS domain S-box protein [Fontisphaera persica]WCJ58884.1 PAS domain S-box protein [Fontisphaera persica]